MGVRLRLRSPCGVTVSELLWLSVLLSLTSCAGEASVGPTPDGQGPVTDLQLHPRQKMLTWKYRSPVSAGLCSMDAPLSPAVNTTPRVLDQDTYFCAFPSSVLHRGATFTVYSVVANVTVQQTLLFRNPGAVGAGATNLSCVVYAVSFMNCSWVPGRTAPADTRYQLFFWFHPNDAEAECAHYLRDSKGMHVGCHFNQLPGEPRTSDNYFFLVNGTSSQAAVPFLDAVPFVPFLNEKYSPPGNVTVRPAGPGFEVRWEEPPRRFPQSPSSLCYELDVQRKGGGRRTQPIFQRGQDQNRYELAEGEAGSFVRLRVRHMRGTIWSEWSAAVGFGPDRGHDVLALARVLSAVGLAALCTVVMMVVCKKYSLQQRLLPPIPRVKDELKAAVQLEQEVTMKEADLPEPHDVLVVQETQ